jgi:hypothetical protein
VNPLVGLVVLRGRGINVLEGAVLGHRHALHLTGHLLCQDLELQRNSGLQRLHLVLEFRQQTILRFGCEALEVGDVAINVLLGGIHLGLNELDEAAHILGLLLELVLLGLLGAGGLSEIGNEQLNAAEAAEAGTCFDTGPLLLLVIVLVIVLVLILIIVFIVLFIKLILLILLIVCILIVLFVFVFVFGFGLCLCLCLCLSPLLFLIFLLLFQLLRSTHLLFLTNLLARRDGGSARLPRALLIALL